MHIFWRVLVDSCWIFRIYNSHRKLAPQSMPFAIENFVYSKVVKSWLVQNINNEYESKMIKSYIFILPPLAFAIFSFCHIATFLGLA